MIHFLKWTERILHDEIASWVHLSMVICALGSVANIFYAFQSMQHGLIPSAFLAIGLGIGLALSAIMASTIPMQQRGRFAFGLAATLFVAAMSGAIQTAGYLQHDVTVGWALIFGFGLPLATELILAIDLANKHDADKQQVLDNAENILELRVSEAIAESLSNLDVSRSKRYVERQIDTILRAKAQQLVAKMVPEGDSPVGQGNTERTPASDGVVPTSMPHSDGQTPVSPTVLDVGRDKANARKRSEQSDRWDSLLGILRAEYDGKPSEHLNKTQLGNRLGVDRKTIGRDITALEQSGRISVNGVVQVRD